MNKKVVVFSIIVSLFILSGLSLVEAGTGVLQTYGTDARVAVNSTFGTVLGGSIRLAFQRSAGNTSHPYYNITVFYNSSGDNTYSKATLSGVTGNTTCVSNVCNGTKGSSAFAVTWTVPSTDSPYNLKIQYRFGKANTTASNYTTKSRVYVDTTAPVIALKIAGGDPTDFAFLSHRRLYKNAFLARVTEPNIRNCSFFVTSPLGASGQKLQKNFTTAYDALGVRSGNTNLARGINLTGQNVRFINMTFNTTVMGNIAIPRGIYDWSVSCADNSTIGRRGTPSSNLTWFFDNETPTFDAEFPLYFDDSDKDSKDTSKSGLFQIGGVWVSELLETITLHCQAKDDAKISTATYFVKLPGQSAFKQVASTNSLTFDFKDTTAIGTYEAYCKAKDVGGNTTQSKTFKFKIQSEDLGEIIEEPAEEEFDIPLHKEDIVSSGYQKGRIVTLSFDGTIEHTVTFDEVTSDSVTLTIKSFPITLRLSIGETKNVDVNDDGLDDLSVTLKGITDKTASIDFKKLEGAASAETPTTISPPATQPRVTPPTTEGSAPSIPATTIATSISRYFEISDKRRGNPATPTS